MKGSFSITQFEKDWFAWDRKNQQKIIEAMGTEIAVEKTFDQAPQQQQNQWQGQGRKRHRHHKKNQNWKHEAKAPSREPLREI